MDNKVDLKENEIIDYDAFWDKIYLGEEWEGKVKFNDKILDAKCENYLGYLMNKKKKVMIIDASRFHK